MPTDRERLADLGRRIQAARTKHGIPERERKALRRTADAMADFTWGMDGLARAARVATLSMSGFQRTCERPGGLLGHHNRSR